MHQKTRPSIIVYSGPMFAGKTTSLIQHYKKSTVPYNKKLVFKYSLDTRYSNDSVLTTHNGNTIPCIMINNCSDINQYINDTISEIYIDECQFLQDIYLWINTIKNDAYNTLNTVILAGLDFDATGNYFTKAFENVINMADINYALYALCYVCGKDACYTKLLKTTNTLSKTYGQNNNVLIGGAELYQPACDTHFK